MQTSPLDDSHHPVEKKRERGEERSKIQTFDCWEGRLSSTPFSFINPFEGLMCCLRRRSLSLLIQEPLVVVGSFE